MMHPMLSRQLSRRPRAVAAASVAPAASAADAKPIAFRLRRAVLSDTPHVSQITAEVFGSGNFTGSGVEDSALIQQLETAYTAAINRESDDKLAAALTSKAEATLAHRTYRMNREAAMLKARLAFAQGQPATFPTEGPTELRQLSKWRRSRQFVCLVAEEVPLADADKADAAACASGLGRLLGTATVSLMQAEAALPPPFPSNAPLRAYISNMAVVPAARRKGVAKALAAACGRIAQAWGQPCVLLHVAADNTAAQRLYTGCGFEPVANSQGLSGIIKGPWTQQRMVADAAALAGRYRQFYSCSRSNSSSSSGGGGGGGGGGNLPGSNNTSVSTTV